MGGLALLGTHGQAIGPIRSAQAGEPPDSASVKQEYLYRPVNGGIEILNGARRFNRPLYSTVQRPDRLIALAGDRPEFMLMKIGSTRSMIKLANLKIGCVGEPWLSAIEPVWARHCEGQQLYRVGEGAHSVELEVVRAMTFEGLLLHVRRADASCGPLVLALGGRAIANYDQSPLSAFDPKECEGTELGFNDNTLSIRGNSGPELFATASVPLAFTAADPEAVRQGPDALCKSKADNSAVAALVAEWPDSGEIYLILTTDDPDSEHIQTYLKDPSTIFAQAVEDNRGFAHAIEVNTPDPYLNVALPHALLGYNAAWNIPTFRHGAIAWHDSHAGWRCAYGGTTAGWHDRVQSHMKAFYDKQHEDGRIPAMLGQDKIYNMGEVLVDQALYDWEWSGDLEPLRNGGFDAIARHLDWGEKHIKTPDGLYENFLNAWNTDYKWCNGGGGTIASVYYWRANRTMADIAERLGKNPTVFKKRADDIASAMRERLWSERAGVYGEYRDRFGLELLHESPDLSSIYTPIDLYFCNPSESYRMLRFALRRFEIPGQDMPRDSAIIYSSEWLPDHYSTRGLYTAEIINTLLALYRVGMSDEAEPFRRAIDGSFFAGPAPGSTGYVMKPDGTFQPHTDFTDVTSMYVRNVVDGLFGIRMNAPDERVTLQPSFPRDWKHASIHCPAIHYEYTWDGQVERVLLGAVRPLTATVRLRARRAAIASVMVNGKPSRYTVEPGIQCAWVNVTTARGTTARVEVIYGPEELPKVTAPDTGIAASPCTVKVDRGRIEEVRFGRRKPDLETIDKSDTSWTIPLPADTGPATFFVRVTHADVQLWMPVEVAVQPATGVADHPIGRTILSATPIDLSTHFNQRLEALHENHYGPLIEPFNWAAERPGQRTMKPNGRSWWEGHGKTPIIPDTTRLSSSGGEIQSDRSIPFSVSSEGLDAVFTSLYTNFPGRVEIPVAMRGSRIGFLLVASIPTSQSRMEVARITVMLGDGTQRMLALRDPETIDDWLGSGTGLPYVQSGAVQPLGKGTHAVVQELDLGDEVDIDTITLETRCNESMVGLLGITVMQQ